jgi:hypothetical protein
MATVIHWERMGEDGETVEVPATWQVCPECGGEGRTLSPAFRGQLDSDMMHDEEFLEEYRKGGRGIYSCSCEACGGRTTVLAPDTSTAIGREYAAWKCEEEWERARERRMQMYECGDVEGFLSGW